MMKHFSFKTKLNYLLVTVALVLLACASIFAVKLIFNQATDVIMEEHDNHLYDLAYSVDVNLYNSLHRVTDTLTYEVSLPEIQALEQSMETNADARQKMIRTLRDSPLGKLDDIKYVMIYKGSEKILCSVCDDDCTMEFLDDPDGDDLSVCRDENNIDYITLEVPSSDGTYTYYALLEMEKFYEAMIADSIKKDNWVVLYDEGCGLLLQSHKNQPAYLILSKEEIEERQDGYTILNHYQDAQKTGAQTYTYENPDGTVTPQRIVVLPTGATKNGRFAIAIAMNSATTYAYINKLKSHTYLVLFLLATVAAILAAVIVYFNSKEKFMKARIDSIQKENELEQQLIQAQVRNSVRQMQPHFLYNALSSIREIVLDDQEYAADLIFDFTTYLRACIHALGKSDPIPFSKEMENIEAYVNIEKMRFGKKLNVIYDIQYDDFMIVPLSIEPLVENAIRHGVYQRGGKGGTVKLITGRSGQECFIRVEDDGIGFDYEALKEEVQSGRRDSTGLMNTCLRLENLLHAKVDIQSTPGIGTKITVTIPL